MIVRNVALLGHKDHGKSTLIGSLLMATGSATQVRINEAKMYSERLHKPFEPAFILDSFAEEREQEMTYDTTRAEIKYRDIALALIDVPGHEELIKSMISGASYGDIAILLVSAKEGEGIKDQTKRHLFLAKMLGINGIVVAINKMDTVGYAREKFDEIREELSPFLKIIGYDSKMIEFVPISAYTAENLVKKSSKIKWYDGESLIDTVYAMFGKASKMEQKELRVLIQGSLDTGEGKLLSGKIAEGRLASGEKVKSTSDGNIYAVKELFVRGVKAKTAGKGDNVAIKLDKPAKMLGRGSVLYNPNETFTTKSRIKALVFATKKLGDKVTIRFIGNELGAKLKIVEIIDPVTGQASKDNKLQPLGAAGVELETDAPIAAEPTGKSTELGRFTIYSGKEFSGIGIINR